MIFWNKDKNVPFITNESRSGSKYISTDIRPVFIEEKYLLSLLIPELGYDVIYKSVWYTSGYKYVVDGIIIKDSIYTKFISADLSSIISQVDNFTPTKKMIISEKEIFSKFIKLNRNHFLDLLNNTTLDAEGYPIGAIPFIRIITEKFQNREPVVSFSGGKDSTVISHLARSAFGNNKLLHINSDTTIEFPSTYDYIKKFMSEYPEVPFFLESIGKESGVESFFELTKKIGPPSRVKSWCCSIFKTGPLGNAFTNMGENWLTFYGIRRSESASRNKYLRVSRSPKIEKQIVASPIIDWRDIDVWLYILTENLDFNIAYRRGFSRVGCWCCPNNSIWSDILMAIYYNDRYMDWHNFLLKFAKEIGKKDADVYVAQGKWKARQGGSGIENQLQYRSILKFTEKSPSLRIYNIRKTISVDNLIEFFKPFGQIERTIGVKSKDDFIILGKNKIELFKISISSKNKLSIELFETKFSNHFNKNNIDQTLWSYIECQLRKYQICINCQACKSACPVGAIEVDKNNYTIDNNKCTHCLKCIKHFPKGCLIASSLTIKKSEEL